MLSTQAHPRGGVCFEEGFLPRGARRYQWRRDGEIVWLEVECSQCGMTPAMFFGRAPDGWQTRCRFCRREGWRDEGDED